MRNTTAGEGPFPNQSWTAQDQRHSPGTRRVQTPTSLGQDRTEDTGGTTGKAPPARRRRKGEPAVPTNERPVRGRKRATPATTPAIEQADVLPALDAEIETPEAAEERSALPEPATTEPAASLVLPQEPSTPPIAPGAVQGEPPAPDEEERAPVAAPRALPDDADELEELAELGELEEPEFEPEAGLAMEDHPHEPDESAPEALARANRGWRRQKDRAGSPRSNALGVLIEHRFADPSSSVRSYSELERHSGISREALSRYVTPRADRRRSPTVDTLAAIADAMHISLEQMCRAAVASAQGITLPSETQLRARDEVIAPLCATLSDEQFSAVVELLRQMQPRARTGS